MTPQSPRKNTVTKLLTAGESRPLYLKPEKMCITAQRRIEFLGVVLERNTIPNGTPTKIKGRSRKMAIPPRNPHRLLASFLGFHRVFIEYSFPNLFKSLHGPLLDLTKRRRPWVWNDSPDRTRFENPKSSSLCSKPVVTLTRSTTNRSEKVVHTDASA